MESDKVSMKKEIRERLDSLEGFQKHAAFLVLTLFVSTAAIAVGNLATPEDPVRVGPVEVSTSCYGFGGDFCIGIERQEHTTYNYDNYENPEPRTENYYRLVESELMIQAYNICGGEVTGMEWVSNASYDNQSGEEWMDNENVQLLPCNHTFYRKMND